MHVFQFVGQPARKHIYFGRYVTAHFFPQKIIFKILLTSKKDVATMCNIKITSAIRRDLREGFFHPDII